MLTICGLTMSRSIRPVVHSPINGAQTIVALKALSVRQPWAHAIVLGAKTIENRSWPTNMRGTIAVHAAQALDDKDLFFVCSPTRVGTTSRASRIRRPDTATRSCDRVSRHCRLHKQKCIALVRRAVWVCSSKSTTFGTYSV